MNNVMLNEENNEESLASFNERFQCMSDQEKIAFLQNELEFWEQLKNKEQSEIEKTTFSIK